jgi:hypothetical protein
MTSAERSQQTANCRLDSWMRLYPVLASLHISLDDGPLTLVDALHEAPLACLNEAQRVLRALTQFSWQVEALKGPYAHQPALGFRLVAGPQSWWLRFQPSARLRLRQVERISPES